MMPRVSLIMPIRNEAQYLRRSLDAVLRQDYPQEHVEILIADGMSMEGSREIIREYQAMIPPISLIENPGKIAPTWLNQALVRARGEIIIRVDGHCEIAPDYVRQCVHHILEDGVDGVGGAMETIGETWVAQTIAGAMSSKFGVGDSAFRTASGQTGLVDTVPFPAYTREIIRRADGLGCSVVSGNCCPPASTNVRRLFRSLSGSGTMLPCARSGSPSLIGWLVQRTGPKFKDTLLAAGYYIGNLPEGCPFFLTVTDQDRGEEFASGLEIAPRHVGEYWQVAQLLNILPEKVQDIVKRMRSLEISVIPDLFLERKETN